MQKVLAVQDLLEDGVGRQELRFILVLEFKQVSSVSSLVGHIVAVLLDLTVTSQSVSNLLLHLPGFSVPLLLQLPRQNVPDWIVSLSGGLQLLVVIFSEEGHFCFVHSKQVGKVKHLAVFIGCSLHESGVQDSLALGTLEHTRGAFLVSSKSTLALLL